jgi:hypothetical protein
VRCRNVFAPLVAEQARAEVVVVVVVVVAGLAGGRDGSHADSYRAQSGNKSRKGL